MAFLTSSFLYGISNSLDSSLKSNQEELASFIAPLPVWVKPESYKVEPASHLVNSICEWPTDFLIEDMQVNIEEQTAFRHVAYQIKNANGVQDYSSINIPYDPQYQTLHFHFVRVIRNGKVLDKLSTSPFRICQQESELDRHLYNGRLTVCIFLEDIRESDIIEYAYSRKGFNPAHQGHFVQQFPLQYRVPLQKHVIRIVADKTKPLRFKICGHEKIFAPTISTIDSSLQEWYWVQENVAEKYCEEDIPGWFISYSILHVSDYNSWGEVAQSLTHLFPTPVLDHLPPEMLELAAGWQNLPAEEQVLEALRFVQDKIRYLGLEEGINAFQPHDPVLVFTQRFGDCKDKTQLLRTFLALLGIESQPVLVHTQIGKSLTDFLSAHDVFNHAILQVKLGDKVYWLDSTINYQGGSLADSSRHPYGNGLVIHKDQTLLTAIPAPEKARVECFVNVIIDQKPHAQVEFETTYFGSKADSFRQSYKSQALSEINKRCRDWLVFFYPSAKPLKNVQIEDDRKLNQIKLKEFYIIPDFVEMDEKDGQDLIGIFPLNLESILRSHVDLGRRYPLDLGSSFSFKETYQITQKHNLWHEEEEHLMIEDDAFRYQVDCVIKGHSAVFSFDYETLDDHVPSHRLDEYNKNLEKAWENSKWTVDLTTQPLQIDSHETTRTIRYSIAALGLLFTMFSSFRYIVRFIAAKIKS